MEEGRSQKAEGRRKRAAAPAARAANAEELPANFGMDALAEAGAAPPVPCWTLRADRRFDMLAFMGVVRLAREAHALGGMTRERLDEYEAALREFELFEEIQSA